jgi:hypothetical protein
LRLPYKTSQNATLMLFAHYAYNAVVI